MSKCIDLKESISKIFYDGWEKIVYGFKNKILPLSKNDDSGDQRPNILHTPKQKRFDNFLKQIEEEQKKFRLSIALARTKITNTKSNA